MSKPIKKTLISTLAILALVSTTTIAVATVSKAKDVKSGDRGTILSVHSAKGTEKFKAALGLPEGQLDGGRYAVVQIDNGVYGEASFALVYVPPQFAVQDDTVVQLNTKGFSVLAKPGSAAVAKVIGKKNIFFNLIG